MLQIDRLLIAYAKDECPKEILADCLEENDHVEKSNWLRNIFLHPETLGWWHIEIKTIWGSSVLCYPGSPTWIRFPTRGQTEHAMKMLVVAVISKT